MITHHFQGSSLRGLGQPGVLVLEGINPAAKDHEDRWKPFAFVSPPEIGALAAGLDRAAESFYVNNPFHEHTVQERSGLIRRAEEAEQRLYAIERARAAATVAKADASTGLACGGCGAAMGTFTFDPAYRENAGAAPWAFCSLVCVEKVAKKEAP